MQDVKLRKLWAQAAEMLDGSRLSVVLPAYNLGAEIAGNLETTAELFERHGFPAELVAVDDGSADATRAELERFERENAGRWPHVAFKAVLLERNGGKGAALRAGFAASSGAFVMLLDGDLDIHPKQTPRFFEAMARTGADVVIGSKRHPRSVVQYPWHRRIVSFVYFTLVRLFIGLPITDTQTGMKLFKRKVLGEALERMLVKTYAFDLELLAIAHSRGAKIAEAPVVIRFGDKFGALKASTVRAMALDTLAVFYRLRILKYYNHVEVPPPLAGEPLVSVVIPCPNCCAYLRECLESLAAQTYHRWEAIVLPDEDFALDDDAGGRICVVPTGKVRPAEKRNEGIRRARGEIVAFIDDDAYADSHWLEYAVKYFSADDIGAVGGPGVTPPGDGFLARLGGRVYDNLLVSGNYRYRYKAGGIRRDVDDYPSCNLFVRRSLLEKIGGYRTDFWPGEDTLLCKDIVDSGKRIVYDPWVVVHHHRRALFAPHLRQLGRYAFHRGYFCKRFPSNSLHLGYFIPSLFVAGLFAAGALAIAAFASDIRALRLAASFAALPYAAYFALVLATTFSFNPAAWLISAAGVFASHVVYGIRFLQGLCASKAPCEFIGKDHL